MMARLASGKAAPQVTELETEEGKRLEELRRRTAHWKRWGPYLSERSWGTVREDYSPRRVGVGLSYRTTRPAPRRTAGTRTASPGISDRHQLLCFALALWNGQDPILKERLFGLSGSEGNHGEDVKEQYFYLDSTPTHSYMKCLYKYPQATFPYAALVAENKKRGRDRPEFELLDTGVFEERSLLRRLRRVCQGGAGRHLHPITATNRGPEAAPLHILPTLWFRNTWAWGHHEPAPRLAQCGPGAGRGRSIPTTGRGWLTCEGLPALLFTENETNARRLMGPRTPRRMSRTASMIMSSKADPTPSARDLVGTKVAAHYAFDARAGRDGDGAPAAVRLRAGPDAAFADFDAVMARRRQEADEFYAGVIPARLSPDAQAVMRQALAGLLWSKQFYHYVPEQWLAGDPALPPPARRQDGRNAEWGHLFNADVLSMPDKWEYPWYAAWDLAFHCLPLSLVDADFAKEQLLLVLREWYMHPNGQLPAYEWEFGDVNPPVHAWAAWRVYKIERKQRGPDRAFLERVFHKLMLNFTWWVNRKDAEGRNVFQGGFLGLDNIGVFDRSAPLPGGGHIQQSDGTSWMAMYCLNLHDHRPGTGPREPVLRGRRQQVLRALRPHRPRHEQHRPRRRRTSGTRRTASTTTCCSGPTGRSHAAQGPLDGGSDPAVRRRDAGAERAERNCRGSSAAWTGSSTTART